LKEDAENFLAEILYFAAPRVAQRRERVRVVTVPNTNYAINVSREHLPLQRSSNLGLSNQRSQRSFCRFHATADTA
jgi:hypothetical protein